MSEVHPKKRQTKEYVVVVVSDFYITLNFIWQKIIVYVNSNLEFDYFLSKTRSYFSDYCNVLIVGLFFFSVWF